MSLVGPRPERPYFVAQFSQIHPGYAARHRMPAGITGLAQVHGLRGDTSIEDRARFDNHYIDTWSLWQDVCILLRTAAALFRPTAADRGDSSSRRAAPPLTDAAAGATRRGPAVRRARVPVARVLAAAP